MNQYLKRITVLAVVMLAFGVISAMAQVNVTATGGTPTATYTTLGGAFTAINAGTHTGAITVDITANTTEAAADVLNSSGAGSASYTSILIRPTVDGVTISGPTVTGRGLIELNGADNVTIDGDNPNTAGTNRNLTITNTAANTVTYAMAIRIAAYTSVITSADNDTIKNLIVNGNATAQNVSTVTSSTSAANASYGIYAGATGTAAPASATTVPSAIASTTTTLGSGGTYTNLIIDNNAVNAAARAIAVQGGAATVGTGLQITNNFIGAATVGSTTNVYSIGITAQGSSNGVIRTNTINNVESYVSANIRAIDIGAAAAVTADVFTIDRNTAANVISRSTTAYGAYGIQIGGGTGNTVQNNFIYGLNAVQGNTAYNTLYGARGIRISAGTNHKIYYNSVNLTGALLGTGSDVSADLTITVSTATGVDVRNNIFVNTQTGTSTSTVTAVQLLSGLTNAFNLTLNNNIYYNGATPTAYQFILSTVTAAAVTTNYTAANFNAAATTPATNSRSYTSTLSAAGTNDNASLVADPLFTSNTDLHLQSGSPARNAAVNVGVTTDFDGQTRPGANAFFDIGADEFDGATPLANDIAATAIIVPATGSLYGIGATVTPQATFTNVGTGTQTNVQVTFTITGPGGYSYTNTQTIASIAANQTVTVTFAAAPAFTTAGTYTTTATVTTADQNAANNTVSGSFTVVSPLSGAYSVPGDYPSLTNANGIFAALNAGGATGNIVINITADLTAETGANALNQLPNNYTVTIKPTGAARTISGAAASTALIRLNGASGVTIDGSTSGGTDRSLTISNTSTTAPSAVRFGSIGTTPITNDTLKNCVVINGVNTSSAILVLDTAGSLGGYFNNITVQNNDVQRAFRGIFFSAIVSGTNGSGTLITGNTLNTAGANSIRLNPIFVAGANGVNITNNAMGNISDANAEVPIGIQLSTGTDNAVVTGNTINGIASTSTGAASVSGILVSVGTTSTSINVSNNTISTLTSAGTAANFYAIGSFSPNVTVSNNIISGMTQTGAASGLGIVLVSASSNAVSGNTISAITISGSSSITSGINSQGTSANVTIERNRIFNIKNTNTGGYGANGIQLSSTSTTANHIVRNNFVYDVAAYGFAGADVADNGYGIIVTSGAGYNVWNNSVNMNTNQTVTTGLPAAFNVLAAVTTAGAIDLRNNIFNNSQTLGTQRYSIYSGAANTVFSAIDYNDYFTTGPNLGFITSNRATLADIQAGFGGNLNSKSVDPLFVSATDLHLQATSPLLGAGVAIGGVTNDYDGDTRDTVPDIGADEVVQGTGGTLAAGTYYNASPAAGTTLGGNVTVTNSLTLNGITTTGGNTLTLDCNATVTGGGTTNFVVGNLRKNFCATGAFTYPVGDNTGTAEYSPFTANVTAVNIVPSALTVSVTDATLPGLNVAQSASRYFTLTETGDLAAILTFTYLDPADVNGTEANYKLYRREAGVLGFVPSTLNAAANTITTNAAITNFSDWGIGNAPTAAPVTVTGRVMTAGGRAVSGARITLTAPDGSVRYAQTNPAGVYRFNGVPSGETYIFTVSDKRYQFSQPTALVFVGGESGQSVNFYADGLNDFVAPPETLPDPAAAVDEKKP